MRLLLLRHGQTSSNVLGLLDTDAPGPSLTTLGERQAHEVPKAFTAMDLHPDALFVSNILRTQQTAVPAAQKFALRGTVLAGLAEIEAGELEDLSDPDSVRTYLTTAFAWADGNLDERVPGGPDGHEFLARFDAAIAQVVATDSVTALVVSHGMAIRAWAPSRATNAGPGYAATHELDNTGLVTLDSHRAADGTVGWTLVDWHADPIMGTQLADATAVDPIKRTLGALR